MGWQVTTLTLVGLCTAIISGAVATVAWRHRSERGALSLFALTLNLGVWSLLYAIQLGFPTVDSQLFWQRLTLGAAGFVPITWLLFTIHYSGRGAWLTRQRTVILLTEPIVFLGFSVSNPMHQLVLNSATSATALGVTVPALSFGPVYTVHIVFAYVAVAAGIGLLFQLGFHVSKIYQKQVALLIAGTLPPFASHIAFTLGQSPIPYLELTPFAFAFTGIVFSLALFRFDLLDLAPVARELSFEQMGDGLVIIDARGRIVDLLGIGDRVFASSPRVGEPVNAYLPDGGLEAFDDTYRTADVDGRQRIYHVQLSSLTDDQELAAGQMLMVRDVTDLRKSEQRLAVSNRVLRHNLRNEMNIIIGYARNLENCLTGQDAADAKLIRRTAEGLLEMSEKARDISELDGTDDSTFSKIDVVDQLESILHEFQEDYPDVSITIEAPESAWISVANPEVFSIAVQNILENAVKHNDASKPRVKIRVRTSEEETLIEVTDNGPGIPEIETRVLDAGTESQMHHSQGLGLWLAHWCVTLSNGELMFDTEPEGTTVTLGFS